MSMTIITDNELEGLDITGKATVISGFPSMGKTFAMCELENDNHYMVVDIDSADFKQQLNDEAKKDWVKHYVDEVQAKVSEFERDKITKTRSRETGIIFVSAHAEVRKELSARGITFLYVVPTMDMLPTVIDGAKHRAEISNAKVTAFDKMDPDIRKMYRHLEVLRENADACHHALNFLVEHGENAVKLATAEEIDHQIVITTNMYLLSLINQITVVDDLREYINSSVRAYTHGLCSSNIENSKVCRKAIMQYAFDNDGRIVAWSIRPVPNKKIAKIIHYKSDISLPLVMNMGMFGAPFMTLSWDSAKALVDYFISEYGAVSDAFAAEPLGTAIRELQDHYYGVIYPLRDDRVNPDDGDESVCAISNRAIHDKIAPRMVMSEDTGLY